MPRPLALRLGCDVSGHSPESRRGSQAQQSRIVAQLRRSGRAALGLIVAIPQRGKSHSRNKRSKPIPQTRSPEVRTSAESSLQGQPEAPPSHQLGVNSHAIREVKWSRTHRYTMVLDVHRFFPSIDHAVMKDVLFKVVRDPEVRGLIEHIIDASNPQTPVPMHFAGDDLLSPLGRRRGLPIGNLTSQFFANILLDQIDHTVKDRLRVKAYLRYADDLAFFSNDKAELWAIREQVEASMGQLRLRLNSAKSRVRRVSEGITFLGFVVSNRRVRLGPVAVRRARRKHRALQIQFGEGAPWSKVADSLQAWAAHAGQGDTQALLQSVFQARPYVRDHGATAPG